MDDVCYIIFQRFPDVTKSNGPVSVVILYREPSGEIVVHYDNDYKIEKGLGEVCTV